MKKHLKMLCADDNDDLRTSLYDQFTAEDFDVDTAADGHEAVKKMTENHYDIVLLDMKMPGKDGREVLRDVTKLSSVPYIIMLTAMDDVSTAQECVKLGAKDYISKPYDPEDLLHVVIKVLGS